MEKKSAAADEKYLREALVRCGKALVEKGLVQGTWGNISVRLDEKYMLTTPSGLDYMRLTPDDMVKVDIDTLKYEGDKKPTSEKGLHGAIYKNREDIGAVIHTHSKYCSVFAAAGRGHACDRRVQACVWRCHKAGLLCPAGNQGIDEAYGICRRRQIRGDNVKPWHDNLWKGS